MRTKAFIAAAISGMSLLTSTGCFVYCRSDGVIDEVYTNVGRHSRVIPVAQPADAVAAKLERSAGEMGLKVVSKHVEGDETRLNCETPNGRRIKVLVCKEKTGCEVSVRANVADSAVCELLMAKVDPKGNVAPVNAAPAVTTPSPTIVPVKAPPPPEALQMSELPSENRIR